MTTEEKTKQEAAGWTLLPLVKPPQDAPLVEHWRHPTNGRKHTLIVALLITRPVPEGATMVVRFAPKNRGRPKNEW